VSDSPEERLSQRFEQGHACVIGIGGDLPSTVGDAKGLAKILTDPERCAYPEHQVHLLTSAEATRSNIITALETLANTTNHESTVLIYFSGHGYQVTKPIKSYYLMPHGHSTEDLAETAISGSEFTDLLREIPAQKLLVVLDCCHAGGLSDISGFQIAKAPLPPEAQRMFARGGGRMLIGSSKPDELSYAGEPYSAFTYALIKGLCGTGAVKQDGYIRATDLAMYTSQVVPTLTDDKQHPVLDIDKADNFILAYYAGGQLQPKGLPRELEELPRIESKPGELNGQMIQTTNIVASGDRAIAIGGSVSGSTFITGDGNVVGSGNVVSNVVQRGKYNINTGSIRDSHIGDTYSSRPLNEQSSRRSGQPNDAEGSGAVRRKTILVLAANPIDSMRLALDQEVREIEEGLRRSKQRDLFKIEQRWAVRTYDLRRALLDVEPHIVHFCGHGTYHSASSSATDDSRKLSVISKETDAGGIVLEDETGRTKLVTGQALTNLFALFNDQVECVVLNSCYSKTQAELIVQQIPIVIGMKREIGDRAAIEFARGFYDALGAGRAIEDAFRFGCNAIDLQNIPEHLTPVIRQRDR
jgi:hypothetical protein